jgi:oxygen-independent coproporphyrinogen-3 oxidase
MEDVIPEYVKALCNEIKIVGQADKRIEVHTIFFGGGTPSLLPPSQLEEILRTISNVFDVKPGIEISLETNPGTLEPKYLRELFEIGFNRISIGMQSANNKELNLLGRIHTYENTITTVSSAREVGFSNLNLDLIYGLPDQTISDWQNTLGLVLGLNPEHVSLYSLTVEDGTQLGRWVNRGLIPVPDPDLAADMYEWAGEELATAGYEHYEVSNWAKLGYQCRHNLQYWRNQPYLGFGAGAHGYADNMRVANISKIKPYIKYSNKSSPQKFPISPATIHFQAIDVYTEMQETMMVGLRLTKEGVSKYRFRERFGKEMRVVFEREINELTHLGLIEWAGDSLRLTTRGILVGNQVFMRFV